MQQNYLLIHIYYIQPGSNFPFRGIEANEEVP